MILNYTANASIGNNIPMQVLTGTTPDISAFLQFDFYEPVYYKTEKSHFPSMSMEKSGRFVGISEHVGHALTFMILTDDTQKVIHRSIVCTATDLTSQNLRANVPTDQEPQAHVQSHIDDPVDGENTGAMRMPIIHPEELVGQTLGITNDDGESTQIRIVEAFKNHQDHVNESSTNVQFRCSINNDAYENILSYNQILEYMSNQDDDDIIWKFKEIVGHKGPLSKTHKDYKGSPYNVTVLWENGETSDEPLSMIAADDPVSCAIYARDKDLLDLPGWRQFKTLAKKQKNLFRLANLAKLQKYTTQAKYKYGVEIPCDFKHATQIDQHNGNTKWQDATKLELESMEAFQVFKDCGYKAEPPPGYKVIHVHLIYDVKHDGRHKVRLVADGHLMDVPDNSVYSSVVSLHGLCILLFLAKLNGLETWGTDIGNAYLEAVTSENVCIRAGPEFGTMADHLLLIYKALYGLRSSGAWWHERLSDVLRKEGFTHCSADPDSGKIEDKG
jgi:hypothetical protein